MLKDRITTGIALSVTIEPFSTGGGWYVMASNRVLAIMFSDHDRYRITCYVTTGENTPSQRIDFYGWTPEESIQAWLDNAY